MSVGLSIQPEKIGLNPNSAYTSNLARLQKLKLQMGWARTQALVLGSLDSLGLELRITQPDSIKSQGLKNITIKYFFPAIKIASQPNVPAKPNCAHFPSL